MNTFHASNRVPCEGEGDCLECNYKNCACNECRDCSNWEWRGPQMKDEALQ